MKDIISKAEYALASSAINTILESPVEIFNLGDNLPLIDDVPDSNKVICGKLSILFVDIRQSSKLTEDVKAKNMVKVYRT